MINAADATQQQQKKKKACYIGYLAQLSNFHHLLELFRVSGDEVQEGQAVEVLGALVCNLDNLMVALQQRDLSQLVPTRFVVKHFRRLHSNLPTKSDVSQSPSLLSMYMSRLREFGQ
jgi:hypothetical protein